MIRALPFALAGLFSASLAVAAEPTAQPASRQAAPWTRITYDRVIVPALGGDKLELTICPETAANSLGNPTPSGFHCQFVLHLQDADNKAFDGLGGMKIRLHYPDGRVIEPTFKFGPFKICIGHVMDTINYNFPFSDNALTEAWLEVHIDQNTYWYEIPYGFTRDPAAPLPPSDPKAPFAGFAPAMKDSPKDAESVRWSAIHYDFGKIQNGWDLQFDLLNPGNMGCLVKLGRKEGQWDFHNPIVKVSVEKDTGGTIPAVQIAERLPTITPQQREDEFAFQFKPLTGRGWATLTITVDDHPYRKVISLGPFLEGMWIEPWRK